MDLNSRSKIAYVFPGQGSQEVGMGRYLYDHYPVAKAIFDQADETLKLSLSTLCFEGPEADLLQTINVQPAILTTSFACLKIFKELSSGKITAPEMTAGHSLGEYTALVYSGAIDFRDALTLVRERGRLMNEAGKKNPGGMLAVIGSEEGTVRELCIKSDAEISNINSPGQIVISGSIESLQKAKEIASQMGIKRLIPLKVSGAFHSRLMQSAADGLKDIVFNTPVRRPLIRVISNVTGENLREPDEIRRELIDQVLNCVQWQKSIEYMSNQEVRTFIEFGHGKTLAGLIKRIDANVKIYNVEDNSIENQLSNILNGE
jgi:[acyl-carrier-protein] S-malonyltransferase